MREEYLAIGEITKPQGVRGQLKLRPITCDIDRFEGLESAYLKDGEAYRPIRLHVDRISPEAVFLTIEGIGDRTKAEALRGLFLYVDRAHAVVLDEDSDFLCDLIGLRGLVTDGRDLGILREVLQPGGNDVYVFRGKGGEVLVPALKSVVEKVDTEEGIMLLNASRLDEVAVFDDH
ncbi:MAG: 16S rRNA processing protein RimM [Clostridia bacterium]|nr:16S rRNA processing protein RimM [Clostridia bacterium]